MGTVNNDRMFSTVLLVDCYRALQFKFYVFSALSISCDGTADNDSRMLISLPTMTK